MSEHITSRSDRDSADVGDVNQLPLTQPKVSDDISLVVGANRVPFIISRKALALAGPMLAMALSESLQTVVPDVHSVEWPEESPYAVEIVLNILNGHFKKIPQCSLSLEQLSALAKFVDKFEIQSTISPFYRKWVQDLDQELSCAEDPAHFKIYWAFGLESYFSSLAHTMVLHTHETDNSYDIRMHIESLKKIDAPPRIISNILKIRQDAIGRVLQCLSSRISRAYSGVDCSTSHRKDKCYTITMGCITKALLLKGLWPIPKAKDVKHSLLYLCQEVKKIKAIPYQDSTNVHAGCAYKFKLKSDMVTILDHLPSPLDNGHQIYFREVAKRL
ncbi:hypothetical protein EJ05DRAFT_484249 [Pseudovirgaria hyperparasitica]|uniref:BTB domain-containing protein n=1 Tax=Pseudovirgaria hyperparasitica TaxID=470096 RepID=A0A6A6WCH1_9PEZI|nr:uncharacterized protein EJ05DRAFT_484249 [Pseudovirgaria hyperparasitica]KAF2760528.1 hypothetical protein EJ05DRAFT_484249 [Pseudovirgaria hyperparasitica]